jgi:hypothetical protein
MGVKLDPIFREKYTLRVRENTLLRKALGPTKNEVTGSGENYIRRSFVI